MDLKQDQEKKLYKLNQAETHLNLEKTSLEEERQGFVKLKAQLELAINDLQDSSTSNESNKKRYRVELEALDKQIEEKQTELEYILPEFDKLVQQESELKASLDASELEKSRLYAKQGRSVQFSNQKDRDRFLKREISESKHLLELQETQTKNLTKEINSIKASLDELESGMDVSGDDSEGRESKFRFFETTEKELRVKRSKLDETRKNLWRQEARLLNSLETLREEHRQAERNLFCKMDRATSQGLAAVRKISDRLGLAKNVYGPLYELFKVEDKYQACVETIAGSSLFHVVVDSDITVTALLDIMNKEKAGRVTFMPLNRLNQIDAKFPESREALPMLTRLKFDTHLTPAMKQVFGKAVICKSLEVASAIARSHGLNAVTLDGDRAEKKGALSGGYVDHRKSRLDAAKSLKVISEKLNSQESEYAQVKEEISKTEQAITQIRDELASNNAARQNYMMNIQKEKKDSANRAKQIERLKEEFMDRNQSLKVVEAQYINTQAQVNGLQQELKSPMNKNISGEEEKRLTELKGSVSSLESELSEIAERRLSLQSKKNVLEIQLNTNLRKQKVDLETRLSQVTLPSHSVNLEAGAKNQELKSAEVQLTQLEEQLAQVEADLEEVTTENAKLEQGLENSKAELLKIHSSLQNKIRRNERYLSKKAVSIKKKEELAKNIRDLGALPDSSYLDKYVNMDSKKLLKKLHQVKEGLKKLSHVNKKAVEQYNNFTKQRETLQTRRSELDSSAKSIEDLIIVLDQRKDEAIQRTFKHVAKNFAEIWKKLVPRGKGQLIMLKKTDVTDEEEDLTSTQKEKEGPRAGIEHYAGISIQVSFNSSTEASVRMSQLSGGQKSLVALALIFAIQRCDPAPFYLFDEIDAALDAQYRTAVANMIKELCEEAQFITTTFRPEMLTHADKFYGVTFVNKVSRIQVIGKEQAKEFVEQEKPQ